MQKIFVILIFLSLVLLPCASQGSEISQRDQQTHATQQEKSQWQTRLYDIEDAKLILKAILNVLQDDGYIVKNLQADLGCIEAKKEKLLDINPFSYGSKYQVFDVTINITKYGNQTRVSASFFKSLRMTAQGGKAPEPKPVSSQKFYQDFFSKVDKAISRQKEKS